MGGKNLMKVVVNLKLKIILLLTSIFLPKIHVSKW